MPYTSFAPSQVATRPFDPSSAIDVGLQDVMTRRAQGLDLESMMTANAQKQAELGRYNAQTPNENAISDLKGATARATDPNVIARGAMGTAEQDAAKGKKLQALLESDIATGKAKNLQEAASARLQQQTSELGMMYQVYQILQSAPPGSPQSQGLWQQLKTKLPPEIAQGMPDSYSPQIADALKRVLTETPGHIQKLAEIAKTNEGTLAVAREHTRGQLGAATTSANAPAKQRESETQRRASVMKAIAGGTTDEGILDEGTSYLSAAIDASDEIKAYKDALGFEVTKGEQGKPLPIIQQMMKHKSMLWDSRAPGALKSRNPYKVQQAPGAEPGAKTNTGIPGVVRK